jgi:muconolactone delta-isomerase
MQFLTLSRRRTDRFSDADFSARREEEIAQARVLYALGFIRHIWQRGDLAGVCLLVEADSEAEVREQLGTLPLARAGMIEITIVPLKPYAGFCPPA